MTVTTTDTVKPLNVAPGGGASGHPAPTVTDGSGGFASGAPASNVINLATGMPMSASDASAMAQINAVLQPLGLQSLGGQAWDMHLHGYSDDEIESWLKTTQTYKNRFPAMEELNKQGRGFTEVDYVNYENGLKSLLQANGIPRGMYDTPDGIASLLVKNVSLNEAQARIQGAAAASLTAPPNYTAAMKALYGVEQGGLTALWLDPDKALPLLQQQDAAAKIAAAGLDQNLQVDKDTAENLAAQGVSYTQAQQGLGQVAQTAGLEKGFGETADQATRIAAAFGDAAAQQTVGRVMKARLVSSQAGGGAAETQKGVAGLSTRSA